jgi:hypothetical protein
VKPVNDMRHRLWQRLRQPFHGLCAVRKNRHLAAARIPLALKGLQRSGLKLALRCVCVSAWSSTPIDNPTGYMKRQRGL